MEHDIMTIEEVAEYLRLSKRTIYRLARNNELPARKVSNKWRFSRERIKKWIANGKKTDE